MKTELLQKLSTVLSALNAISVSGKNNLTNLSGSISYIEDIYKAINEMPDETADNTND